MKYSFMSFSTPQLSLEEMIQVAVKYGYDGIEPRLDAGHKHGVEVATGKAERAAIKKMFDSSEIELACLATSLRYADPGNMKEMIDQTHERIDLAGDLAAPVIRVFGGGFPKEMTREQAIEQVAGCLARVADHAAERGVVLCVETHDSWCNPEHLATVLKLVDHPAVAANWDIMHPVRTKNATIDQSFEALKPWIRHLHVHDGKGSDLVPIGQGDIDHRRAIELLKTIEYDGFISGEWINWEPYDVHLPREIATLKRYEQELS